MGDNGNSERTFDFVCFRCNRPIKPGEKMLSVCVSLETTTADGSIKGIEAYTISQLCFGCASVTLTEAVVDKDLLMPTTPLMGEEREC